MIFIEIKRFIIATVWLWGCEAVLVLVVLVEARRWIYLMSYILIIWTHQHHCALLLSWSQVTNVAAMIWTCSWWDTLHLHNMWSRCPSLPRTRTRHPTGKAQDISELKSTTKIRGCKIFFPAVIPQIFPDTEPHSTGHAFCCLHLVTSQYSNIYACPNFYQDQTFLEYWNCQL